MKKLAYIGGVVALAMTVFGACDTIGEGERKQEYTGSISSERKVLLEDYTGVRCPNCPDAAAEIERLQEFYGDALVVVGVYPHRPTNLVTPWNAARDQDLRTDVAETWRREFSIEQLPTGMVNRLEGIAYTEWGGAIAEIISDGINYVDLSVSASLPTDTSVSVNVSGSFVEDYEADGAIHVITMILEDSIVVPQSISASSINPGYVHNHVLRTVLGSAWGDQVASEAPTRGTTFSANYTGTLDPVWRRNKLSVVVAVVNNSSREVIQVAQVHLDAGE